MFDEGGVLAEFSCLINMYYARQLHVFCNFRLARLNNKKLLFQAHVFGGAF